MAHIPDAAIRETVQEIERLRNENKRLLKQLQECAKLDKAEKLVSRIKTLSLQIEEQRYQILCRDVEIERLKEQLEEKVND